MANETPQPPAPPPSDPPPAPGTAPAPWYQGKADAEIVGLWQNKGWKVDDPAAIAVEATKVYREAEKFLGVPKDQLLRMPRAEAPEDEIKAFWQRLGAPADPKEYDFAGIKFADGSDLDDKFADAMRGIAAKTHLSKENALEVARAFVKFTDADETEKTAAATAALDQERAALAKNWGANTDANKFVATQAAKALGVSPEEVAALEKVVGYSRVMEMFRQIGTKIGEDKFVMSPAGGNRGVMTREAAMSRSAELKTDAAWVARYLAGGAAEKREMTDLNRLISGDFESAA